MTPDEVYELAMKMFRHAESDRKRHEVAESLGVSVESLIALRVGVGWDNRGRRMEFSSWPSINSRGETIGIVRRYSDGAKRTFRNTSNAGVFAVEGWWESPGKIWVVEGGSDVAACVTHGRPAIGRPNNSGGGVIIKSMLRRRCPLRRVIVWGENDKKEICPVSCKGPHCPACWPGLHGANAVRDDIGDKAIMKLPTGGSKDVRVMLEEMQQPV